MTYVKIIVDTGFVSTHRKITIKTEVMDRPKRSIMGGNLKHAVLTSSPPIELEDIYQKLFELR